MDLERQLRENLAAREPDADFEARVMAGLARQRTAAPRRQHKWRWTAALAASALAAATGLQWYAVQQREARAHQQMLLAMQITSFELNQLQQRLTRNEQQEQ
jgi:hypothetical protein